jgi:hypothetical protein
MIAGIKTAAEARQDAILWQTILGAPDSIGTKVYAELARLMEFLESNRQALQATPNDIRIPTAGIASIQTHYGFVLTTTNGVAAPTGYVGPIVNWSRIDAISWADQIIGEELAKILQADVVNNNAVANTLLDTGLEFTVKSGQSYYFKAFIPYTAQATSTGSRWVVDGPASTLTLRSTYTLTAITQTVNFISAYNTPALCNASSLSINNAELKGSVTANANGTVKIRFASEIANSAITAKAGAILKYTRIL